MSTNPESDKALFKHLEDAATAALNDLAAYTTDDPKPERLENAGYRLKEIIVIASAGQRDEYGGLGPSEGTAPGVCGKEIAVLSVEHALHKPNDYSVPPRCSLTKDHEGKCWPGLGSNLTFVNEEERERLKQYAEEIGIEPHTVEAAK